MHFTRTTEPTTTLKSHTVPLVLALVRLTLVQIMHQQCLSGKNSPPRLNPAEGNKGNPSGNKESSQDPEDIAFFRQKKT